MQTDDAVQIMHQTILYASVSVHSNNIETGWFQAV